MDQKLDIDEWDGDQSSSTKRANFWQHQFTLLGRINNKDSCFAVSPFTFQLYSLLS